MAGMLPKGHRGPATAGAFPLAENPRAVRLRFPAFLVVRRYKRASLIITSNKGFLD